MGILDTVLALFGLDAVSVEASQTTANDLLKALQKSDAAGLKQCLWWPLRLLLTETRTKKIWSGLDSLFGPVETFTFPELHEDGRLGVRTMKSLVRFGRGRMAVSIRSWGDKVVGLGVHAPVTIGLAPKWEAPEYVDEDSFTEEEVGFRPYWVWPSVKGLLTLPRRKGRKATVLLVPGSGMLDRDASIGANKPFKDLAYGLASAGFIVLRPDKPIPVLLWKQLITKTITMYDEYVPHHVAALRYLACHPEVDPEKIFVVGASLGGRLAPRICAASDVPVAGMISLAGASRPLVDEMLDQFEYLQEHLPKPKEAYEKERSAAIEVKTLVEQGKGWSKGKTPSKDFTFPISMSYFIDDHENDPVRIAGGLDLPLLFMQGAQDWQVPCQDIERWKKGLKGSKAGQGAVFRVYDDVGHLFIAFKNDEQGVFQYDEPGHVAGSIISDIVQWIKQVVQQ